MALPFLWATDVYDQVEYQEIVSGQIQHPLTIGRAAFTFLYTGIEQKNKWALNRGFEMISTLDKYPYQLEKHNSIVYLYPDNYQDFKGKEWWSAMANSIIASSYLLAYEIRNDQRFKDRAIKIMNGVIQPIEKNGCAYKMENGGTWYLEYADNHRTDSTAYFVHNGFTYSLLAIKYFEKFTLETIYTEAFNEGMIALEQMEKQYFFKDDRWTYYMQFPRTIESLHYSIFELILLEGLLSETQSEILSNSLEKRKNIIKKEYGLFRNKEGKIYFNLISAPHFYWQDLYPTTLVTYYSNGKKDTIVKIPRDYSVPAGNRLFVAYGEKSELVDSVDLYQNYNNRSYKLITLKPQDIVTPISGIVSADVSLSFQGKLIDDKTVELSSEKEINRTLISYKLPYTVDLYNMAFFGWIVKSEVPIESMMINLIGSYGESCTRYYLEQPANELNLILLKGISFPNYVDFKSKRIKEVQINYYYKAFKGETKKIEFSKLFASSDPTLLYNLMNHQFGNYNFEEKIIEGNIY
ncbi:MAG: D-glucuronyl C5-epimerase family protein [Crocinitomicaceae bacterium]|nr:hypothetical protein [Crocinitomicaceae bacterium]